jgi:PA14 domain/Malectin domain
MRISTNFTRMRRACAALGIAALAFAGVAQAGVRATYYNGFGFSGTGVQAFPQNINFNWGVGAPVSGINADNFSARYVGQLTPTMTATHDLCVAADDGVRLFVNGYRVIDDWNDSSSGERCGKLHLSAGQTYWLQLEYYENSGDAAVQLLWSNPLMSKQVVPASALSCCSDRNGVSGRYFANANFEGVATVIGSRQINFDWRTASPLPGQARGPFSMRWSGNFTPRFNEQYTLYVTVAGGVRVRLNGEVVLERLNEIAPGTYQIFRALQAGVGYNIEIEYIDRSDDAVLRLEWASANQRREVIPTSAFFAQFGFGNELNGSSYLPEFNSATAVNIGGGATGTFRAVERSVGGGTFTTTRSIDTTRANFPAPESVYQSERWGTFSVTSPVLAQGRRYKVRLHFAEIYWGVAGLGGTDTGPGTRLMDVNINGQRVLTRFDAFTAAGGANRAVVREFEAFSNSFGEIKVDFKTSPDSPDVNATFSGIEYIELGF